MRPGRAGWLLVRSARNSCNEIEGSTTHGGLEDTLQGVPNVAIGIVVASRACIKINRSRNRYEPVPGGLPDSLRVSRVRMVHNDLG